MPFSVLVLPTVKSVKQKVERASARAGSELA